MPYKQTATQCVVRLVALRLPTGAQRPPLLLPLPEEYRHANLRRAELTWRADHYELCLTLETGETLPPPLPAGAVAGVDLGEVHLAAVTTTNRQALRVSGRQVRSCKPWRNTVGARRTRRLKRRQAEVSAKRERRQTRAAPTRPLAPGGAQGGGLRSRGRGVPDRGGGLT